jgi:hypothetical protein
LEQSDKKNDGSNAVRPTCAPNRVPQEHEFSTTIKNSQAVLEQSDKKNEAEASAPPHLAAF